MKRKLIVSSCLLFFAACCCAQSKGFNIADYKYRTNGFKALSFYGVSNAGISTGNSSSKNFLLAPSLTYRYQYSTDEKQFNLDFDPSIGINTTSTTAPPIPPIPGIPGVPSQKISTSSFTGSGSLSVLTRQFKASYFIEYGGSALLYSLTSSQKDESVKNSNTQSNYYFSPQIGVGRGRLEYISDAQMAMFILNDLSREGKIRKEIPAETANAFARLITDINNKRIFDFRKRRMYELKKIDSFLRASNLVTSCDIDTYNIINDNWSFAIQPAAIDAYESQQRVLGGPGLSIGFIDRLSDRESIGGRLGQMGRYSGLQYYVRLFPFVAAETIRNKTDSSNAKNSNSSRGADLSVGVEQHIPVNLQWQLKRFASVDFSVSNNSSNQYGSKASSTGNMVGMEAGMGIGYYPNTRTVLQATGFIGLSKGLKTNTSSASQLVVSPVVQVNGDYFLSYMSRISGSVMLSYVSKQYTGGKSMFSFNYYLQYRVYIF
jgi:hypothetical protein